MEHIGSAEIGPLLIYRKMREMGITVSIDGHGVDEMACGYERYARMEMFNSWPSVVRFMRHANVHSGLINANDTLYKLTMSRVRQVIVNHSGTNSECLVLTL